MERLTRERLDEILDRMRGVHALVLGDLMLDVYLRGVVSRISPEAPVPVVQVLEEWRALGGAANVVSNVVALGATCEVVGCLGRDQAGEAVRQELAQLSIEGRGIQWLETRPTTVKTRIMARHQQVARYDREVDDPIDDACIAAVADAIDALAPSADVLILADYNKGLLVPPVITAALDGGRRLDRPVVVDPKADNFFEYRGATVFKPNRAELSAALEAPVLAEDAEWMARTRQHMQCSHLLITLGDEGIALITEEGAHVRVPATARSVYDVSGAGDTVTAVAAVALAAGATPVEAATLANQAAGAEVAKAGVATVGPDELRETVQREPTHAEG